MADEWSKPVKGANREWASSTLAHLECIVDRVDVFIADESESAAAPREVVLRLLAAEASDRLGWVWEQGDTSEGEPMFRLAIGGPYLQWKTIGARGFEFRQAPQPLTPDEFLAAMHGRFLLADALREAGQ